jgi:DNA end-binding protein Ku
MAAPRATWKGQLKLARVSCPVRLFKAVSEAERVSLHLLDRDGLQRIQMRPHRADGTELPRSALVRGFEVEPGRHVPVTEEELENLEVDSARAIVIDRFVDAETVDPLYLDQPYYLAPAGPLGDIAFRVIHAAMGRAGKVALGRLTMAQRERPVLIQRRGRGLLLTTLRSAEEVRDAAAAFADIADAPLDETLLALAGRLIEERSGPFEPALFEDRYQAALAALIRAKLAGTAPPATASTPDDAPLDLRQALQASLEPARKPPAKSRRRKAAGDEAAPRRQRLAGSR